MSGPKSCLLAAGFFVLFGVGSIAAAKVFLDGRNAEIIAATKRLSEVIDRAGEAPGAEAVRTAGCEQVAVLTPADLQSLARDLAGGSARKKAKAPADAAERVPDETVVVCATTSNQPPGCADVARTYAGATSPAGPFLVTVQHPQGERCAERFDAAAAPLGSTTSPNVPLLIDPK